MVYECDECKNALPPSVTVCPNCGEVFDNVVPADAEMPRNGFSPAASSTIPLSVSPKLPASKVGSSSSFSGTRVLIALPIVLAVMIGAVALTSSKTDSTSSSTTSSPTHLTKEPTNTAVTTSRLSVANNPAKGNVDKAAQEDKKQAAERKSQQRTAQKKQRQEQQKKQQQEADASAEADYKIKFVSNALQLSNCLTTFSGLCQEHRFFDEDWRVKMAVSLVEMKQLSHEGQAISCPKRFRAVQKRYSEALNEYEHISDDMPEALDHMDADKLQECLARMNNAGELIKSAQAKLDELDED